jgi:hypothetical protein
MKKKRTKGARANFLAESILAAHTEIQSVGGGVGHV